MNDLPASAFTLEFWLILIITALVVLAIGVWVLPYIEGRHKKDELGEQSDA